MLLIQVDNFLRRLFQSAHENLNLTLPSKERKFGKLSPDSRFQGRYGIGPESSTNFCSAAMTSGRANSSQKMSSARSNPSRRIGFMNSLLADGATGSYFANCSALDRALRA